MSSTIKFPNQLTPEFFPTVKERVNSYFEERNLSTHANWEMILKSVVGFGTLIGSYALIISNQFGPWMMLFFAVVIGLSSAFIGFNVGHDANHGGYSSNSLVNKILSYSFELVGASSYLWILIHNVIHHTFTNIPGHDEDIDGVPLVRINPAKPLKKYHRFQHWYAFGFYALTTLSWIFLKDYKCMFQKNIGNYGHIKHPIKEYVVLFFSKFLYYFVYIIIPMLVLNIPWWMVLVGFVVLHVVQGMTLAIVFQMAHVVEEAEFFTPDQTGTMENTWAVHQMRTTANFAPKNPLAVWCFGGLTFQIEHHLFPKICHIHYKRISEIVKETAGEFGVPYRENRTFFGAIKSHIRFLKKFGTEINPLPA